MKRTKKEKCATGDSVIAVSCEVELDAVKGIDQNAWPQTTFVVCVQARANSRTSVKTVGINSLLVYLLTPYIIVDGAVPGTAL